MLGTQGMMDREARYGLERHAAMVVGLAGFGKTGPASSGSTRHHAVKSAASPGLSSLALAIWLGINAWPPTGAARLPCQ
jgi:hypothetical protein